jgi:hypothetical protein
MQNLDRIPGHVPVLDLITLGHLVRHRRSILRCTWQKCSLEVGKDSRLRAQELLINPLQFC